MTFVGNSILNISENIKKGNIKFSRKVSDEAKYIVLSILTQNPEKRPSLSQILRHPLIQASKCKSPSRAGYSSNKVKRRSKSRKNSCLNSGSRKKRKLSSVKRSFKEQSSKSFRKRELSSSSKYRSIDKGTRKYYNSFLQRRKNSKNSAYSASNESKFKKASAKSYTSILNGYLNKNSNKEIKKRAKFEKSFCSKGYKDTIQYFSKKSKKHNVSTDRSLRGMDYSSNYDRRSRSRKRETSSQKLTKITKNLRSEIFKRLGLGNKASSRYKSPNGEKKTYSSRKVNTGKNYSCDFTVNNFKFNREASDLYGLRTQPSGENSETANVKNSKKSSPHYTSLGSKQDMSLQIERDYEVYPKKTLKKSRDLKSLSRKLKNLAQLSSAKKPSRKVNLRDRASNSISNKSRIKSRSSKNLKTTNNFYSNRKENYDFKKSFFKTISGQEPAELENRAKKRNLVTRKSKNMRSFGNAKLCVSNRDDDTKRKFLFR